MLRLFYESVVASAIFFVVTCWGSGLRVADTNRLNKLIRRAGEIVGEELDSLTRQRGGCCPGFRPYWTMFLTLSTTH